MLNRRLSNYLFYLILLGIIAIVYLIRSIMLGGLIGRTDDLDNENIILQAQIDNLEDVVQQNKNIQESHLYELYNQVPQTFSQTELNYLTIAILELAGIDESDDFDRQIEFNTGITFANDTTLYEIGQQFDIVEVQVSFSATDMIVINNFIDLLNSSEQVFVVNYVEFYVPNGGNLELVNIHFLSFFEKEDLS